MATWPVVTGAAAAAAADAVVTEGEKEEPSASWENPSSLPATQSQEATWLPVVSTQLQPSLAVIHLT